MKPCSSLGRWNEWLLYFDIKQICFLWLHKHRFTTLLINIIYLCFFRHHRHSFFDVFTFIKILSKTCPKKIKCLRWVHTQNLFSNQRIIIKFNPIISRNIFQAKNASTRKRIDPTWITSNIIIVLYGNCFNNVAKANTPFSRRYNNIVTKIYIRSNSFRKLFMPLK